mmetsp:Transcript_28230/g.64882  ORF Transcript_28230/g.64882 Transcript_28230/m.64882 type:complete len:684 (-) Transcript_28230:247-2298(-)
MMTKGGLHQLVLRLMIAIYILRQLPVTQYLLKGQVAVRSALASYQPAPPALGGPRGAAALALDAAAATAADLAAAAQPGLQFFECVGQDENGHVLISVTGEHATIASVRAPLLQRQTVFNVSAARWQLDEVELAPDDEEEEAEPAAMAADAPTAATDAELLAPADATAAPAEPPAPASNSADLYEPEPEPGSQFLDRVLRFRNARTRKSILVLVNNNDAVKLRKLHRRAVVLRQLVQIEKDVKRSGLGPVSSTRLTVLREVLVAYALQPPLADRYCQGNNLLASAIVRAFFHRVDPDVDSFTDADAGTGQVGAHSAFPHLGEDGMASLRNEFVELGLFPAVAATKRALQRLRAQDDDGRAFTAWASSQVLAAFQFVISTQGMGALSLSEGGREDDLKAGAVRSTFTELLHRAAGPLGRIRTEAEAVACAPINSQINSMSEQTVDSAADAAAEAAAARGFERAAKAAEKAARQAEAAVAEGGVATAPTLSSALDAPSLAPSSPVVTGPPATTPQPMTMDLIGAMLSSFDPLSAMSTLGIPPSCAQLGGCEPTAEEQSHYLELWRAVLRAGSAAEAQSVVLKAMGARLLGYCHEVRGRRWSDPWTSTLLSSADIFSEDWSATLRAHLAAQRGNRAARAKSSEVLPDKQEWLATNFNSGWRSPELERALLRSRLPSKLRPPPIRSD